MNREDIIRMARDVGLPHWYEEDTLVNESRVIKFAQLVAAKEREACAKVCDDIDKSHWGCEAKASWCSDAIRARGEV
jgi:hypothetical protein